MHVKLYSSAVKLLLQVRAGNSLIIHRHSNKDEESHI